MKLLNIIKIFANASDRKTALAVRGFYNHMSDADFLKMMFKARMGAELDLENPKTFNEKLQWLKLHNRRPEYTQMVDKFGAKEYVASVIGDEYIIPTIGVWDRAEDIDFDSLPNQFVLKCTHDSGGLVICKDKDELDIEHTKERLKHALKTKFYASGREWVYQGVTPRIIAEKYMEDSETKELRDYKFFCFDGVCKCFKIDVNRFAGHSANYYDEKGNLLDFGETMCPPDQNQRIVLPESLQKMITLAEQLSSGIPFVRVDFYDVDGNIYFGELTFYPASGFGSFTDINWDLQLGEWIDLNSVKIGRLN